MTAAEVIARLVENADLLHVDGAVWMLAPVTDAMLDALATVGTRAEDMEIDDPTESDGDDQDHIAAV